MKIGRLFTLPKLLSIRYKMKKENDKKKSNCILKKKYKTIKTRLNQAYLIRFSLLFIVTIKGEIAKNTRSERLGIK